MKAKSSRKNEPNSPPAARGPGREKWRVASGGRTVARVLRALMAAGTPRFSYFSILFTVHLFRQWIPSLERFTFASATCNPQPRIHGLQIIGLFPSSGAAFGARGIGEPSQTQDVRNT